MTDNSGVLPDPAVFYSAPMRGRLAQLGLQGATVASLVYGGLPSPPGASEPSGDAGEGRDLTVGLAATDKDRAYSPHPYLPSEQKLDYVHKLGSASLVTLVLAVVVILVFFRPARALRVLEGRAGGS